METRSAALVAVTMIALLATSAAIARASLLRRYTGQEMAQLADAICVGKVTGIAPGWSRDARAIVTDVAVRVERPIKRTRPGEVIHLTIPGGTLNGLTARFDGTPDFYVGERALLYLERTLAGELGVLGWRQGKWGIEDGYLAGSTWSEELAVTQIERVLGLPQAGVKGGLVQRGPLMIRSLQPARPTAVAPPGPEAPTARTTLMKDGFERAFPGQWAIYNNPRWGKTNYNQKTGTYSAYCCKAGRGGKSPPGPYPPNMEGWIYAGPFDLSDAAAAHLEFDFWLNSAANDSLIWGASSNGSNFSVTSVWGDSQGWVHCPGGANEFDFSPFLGQSQVWICLIFQSDASTEMEGAYIDNVRFYKTLASGPLPVINRIRPSTASGNTDTVVTLKGSNFGMTRGSVKFPYAGSTSDAPIVSWNNTTIKCRVPGAESGSVRVRSAGGQLSAPKDFAITFTYSGFRWPGNGLPDTRTYNRNGTPDCPGTGEFAALNNAFRTWADVPGTKARCRKLANTAAMPNLDASDSNHVLAWVESAWPFSAAAIAVTATWFSGTTLADHDIVFNGEGFAWTSSGEAGKMDVETMALHETGHWWSLADLYGEADSAKTMYGFGSAGHVDHTLDPADAAGICWVYPATTGAARGPARAAVSGLVALPVGRGAQVMFSLSAPAFVAVRVANIAGRPIRAICQAQEMATGRNVILWDGRTDNGRPVPSGTYLVQVTASTTQGGRANALATVTVSPWPSLSPRSRQESHAATWGAPASRSPALPGGPIPG